MDLDKIEGLIQVLENSQVKELSVRKGEVQVHVRKGAKPRTPPLQPRRAESQPNPAAAPDVTAEQRAIRAPMVGIFHVKDGVMQSGARVTEGQVVGAIESMKLLNDVVSDISGVVTEVMVEDGMPVEYGQPLCVLEVD